MAQKSFYFVSYITPSFWERFLYVFPCFLSLKWKLQSSPAWNYVFHLTGLQVRSFPSSLIKSVLSLLFITMYKQVSEKGFRHHFSWEEIYIWSFFLSHVQQSVSVPMCDETTSPFKLLLAFLFMLLCTLCNRALWKEPRRATPQGGKSSFSFDVLMSVDERIA